VRICRKLDGVALAIELAARRVEAYGLRQTENLLDQHLALLMLGRRSATPRQRTLHAALDWSYQLLSELERAVLRRLAVFVGHFTLEAALAVVASPAIDQSQVLSAIDSLVAKSMVATDPMGAMMRYRLLDTTRAYVLNIATDKAEAGDLAVRHATYYRRWLELRQAGCKQEDGRVFRPREPGPDGLPHEAGRKQKDRSEREQLWKMAERRSAVLNAILFAADQG
jgi:predicted ATPase